MQSINNESYCNLCNCVVSCNKRFVIDSHQNTSKHQKAFGSRFEDLIPKTSQTFLRSSDTDFVEKVTKAFLSADIPLYKLNIRILKTSFVTLVTDCHLKPELGTRYLKCCYLAKKGAALPLIATEIKK